MINKKINNQGMTLIEVMIATSLFVLLFGGFVEMLLWANHGKDVVWEQLTTQNEGRKVVQDFVNDLRRANFSNIGAYPLEIAQSQQIVFYSNVDLDNWLERTRYFLDGKVFKKGITKPSGTPLTYPIINEVITEVAHDVANATNSVFYYYDQSFTGVTDTPMSYPINVLDVRVIGIQLMLEEKPNVSPAPFYIEAKTSVRNLKTN